MHFLEKFREALGWKPIETAPKDLTPFIGARIGADGNPYVCLCFGHPNGNIYVMNPCSDFYKPLHVWMPLPDVPKTLMEWARKEEIKA